MENLKSSSTTSNDVCDARPTRLRGQPRDRFATENSILNSAIRRLTPMEARFLFEPKAATKAVKVRLPKTANRTYQFTMDLLLPTRDRVDRW